MKINFNAIKISNSVNFKKAEKSKSSQYFMGKHKNIPYDSFELSSSKKAEEEEKTIFDRKKVKSTFRKMGINIKKCDDGMYTLSEYRQPDENTTFKDLGIDENELLKYVKEIKGNADFKNSNATSTGSVLIIGGDADFEDSKIETLNKLLIIKRNAIFLNSKVNDTSNLMYIGEDAYFTNSNITNLKNIKVIGGDAFFSSSIVEDTGKLKYIRGNAHVANSKVILPSEVKIGKKIIL